MAASLIAVPVFAGGIDGPGEDCPKKKKTEEDSLDIYEEENKVKNDFVMPIYQPQAKPPVKQGAKTNAGTAFDKNRVEANNVDGVEEEDPNSAMTFNFIYYIIDKFKFTDPLE